MIVTLDITIDTVKNIAAVIGCIMSAAALMTLVSKRVRTVLSGIIHKYSETDTLMEDLAEIKQMLVDHIREDDAFREEVRENNNIALEFTKTRCRALVKDMFYKYRDTKVLPIYERKALMNIEKLYIEKLNCNSYAALLIREMNEWDIDYDSVQPGDPENDLDTD